MKIHVIEHYVTKSMLGILGARVLLVREEP